MKRITMTLFSLLGFVSLAGLDDTSLAVNGPHITSEDIFKAQFEEYNFFIESLKRYFKDIGNVTKVLDTSVYEFDLGDEVQLLLLHILFVETQLEMMRERMPVLEEKCKELTSKLRVGVY